MRELCILKDGTEVYAWGQGDKFYDHQGVEVGIVIRHTYIKCMDMTQDQYIFETDLKSRTMKGDYSKNARLMYIDSMMSGFYKMWREAKGLPVDDAYYPLPNVIKDTRTAQYYSDHKYKGD